MSKGRMRGVRHFHFEQGAGGGRWAFQDERSITTSPTFFYCKTCVAFWDKTTAPNGPPADAHPGEKNSMNGIPFCAPGTHDFHIFERWSYAGLHVLRNGDRLTLFDKTDPTKIVWQGDVKLLVAGPVRAACGFWIHEDQDGVDRDTWAQWFFDQLPAEFIPA